MGDIIRIDIELEIIKQDEPEMVQQVLFPDKPGGRKASGFILFLTKSLTKSIHNRVQLSILSFSGVIMAIRKAEAIWTGTLKEGKGSLKLGSGVFEGAYTWASRFAEAPGTNPEELIGAAHAGCYSMFLSSLLTNAGYKPTRIHTTAKVHLEAGPTITVIELETTAEVPGLDKASFLKHAEAAKKSCPVSKALTGVEIQLKAELL